MFVYEDTIPMDSTVMQLSNRLKALNEREVNLQKRRFRYQLNARKRLLHEELTDSGSEDDDLSEVVNEYELLVTQNEDTDNNNVDIQSY